MKWIVKKSDLLDYRQKFHGKLAGFAEDIPIVTLPLPHYYILILDEEKIHIIQFNLNFKQVMVQTIFLHDIIWMHLSGLVNKKLSIKTLNFRIKLLIKPMAIGIQADQKLLIERLTQMAK